MPDAAGAHGPDGPEGLDGPDGSASEELLETRQWQPSRRVWIGVAVAAVVAAAVTGLVLARGGGSTPQAARTTAAATPTATPQAAVSTVPRVGCLDVGDSALNCGVSPRVPPATLDAALTVLPRASLVSATTVTGRDGRVYSRRVLVRTRDGSTLLVRISPQPGQPGQVDADGADGGRTVSVDRDVGRRHVQLVVRVHGNTPVPALSALQRLAGDPRLQAVR